MITPIALVNFISTASEANSVKKINLKKEGCLKQEKKKYQAIIINPKLAVSGIKLAA